MLNGLITSLFLAGAGGAMAVIMATLRAYRPVMAALRRQAAQGVREQEVRVTETAFPVNSSGQLLHGRFSRRANAPGPALRAAA